MGRKIETVIKPDGADMYKFGHVELDVTEDELKRHFNFGDMLKVTIEGTGSFIMPFCQYYDAVEAGELVLCTYTKGSFAVVARNYKSFGVELGILEANTQNENYRLRDISKKLTGVTIEPERKADDSPGSRLNGYRRKKEYTFDFRMMIGNKMRDGVVFRSSSPIDNRLSDSAKVDEMARSVGIQSIIDLSDTKEEAERFPNFYNAYCSECKTVYLNLPLDVTSAVFKKAVCAGITFIAESEPPYVIFCSEGRDRTGLFAALLQALCGTELPRIVLDYALSFELFCDGVMEPQFLEHIENSFKKNLQSILGVEVISQESLQGDTEKFLLSTGLPYETICKVRNKIGAEA